MNNISELIEWATREAEKLDPLDNCGAAAERLWQIATALQDQQARIEELTPSNERKPFFQNNEITVRNGDEYLVDGKTGSVYMDSYRIMPIEDFNKFEKKIVDLEAEREWVSVEDRLPELDDPVLVLSTIGKTQTILGTAIFTCRNGDVYKDTDNDGEPVWELWTPHFPDEYSDRKYSTVIGPNDVSHWRPLPPPPEQPK